MGTPLSESLVFSSVQLFNNGSYRAVASAGGTEVIGQTITVSVEASEPSAARLLNLSTRALSLTGDKRPDPGLRHRRNLVETIAHSRGRTAIGGLRCEWRPARSTDGAEAPGRMVPGWT